MYKNCKKKCKIQKCKKKLLEKFIKYANSIIKKKLHNGSKNFKNMISTLLRQSTKNSFDKYFKYNIINMKNTWKGIKSIIYLQKLTNESPKIITFGDQTVINPQIIVNTLIVFSVR